MNDLNNPVKSLKKARYFWVSWKI